MRHLIGATPEKYFLLPHNQKESDYQHIPMSQDVIIQMNGHQELSSETPYTWSSSEPCGNGKPLVRLHEDKRKRLYQKQVSVLLRNKLHYLQHSCIAGVYNAPDVIPEWKGLTAFCHDIHSDPQVKTECDNQSHLCIFNST
jgi:hypothetical protein